MVYAGFWKRFSALVIDILILTVPAILTTMVLPYVGGAVLSLLYRPIFDASPLGMSPGRALMGIRVVTLTGERVSLRQAYVRYLFSFLSGFFCMVGHFVMLFNSKSQTVHDMIAETVVIEVGEVPGINFFKVWVDEVSRLFNFGPREESLSSDPFGLKSQLSLLKSMLDQGLITPEDYEIKKAELLSKIS